MLDLRLVLALASAVATTGTLDTMSFFSLGTEGSRGVAGALDEAARIAGWVTFWGPPVPCESAAGPHGSPVDAQVLQTISEVYRRYRLPAFYTELPDCGTMPGCRGIWQRQPYPYRKSGMDPNWQANLDELIAGLRPFTLNGTITGVFLGSEPWP